MRVNTFSVAGGARQPILLSVRGKDMAEIATLATQVEEAVEAIPGTMDIRTAAAERRARDAAPAGPQRLSDLGLTSVQVASALRTAFEGTVATELRRENEDKVDIRVKYATARGEADPLAPSQTSPCPRHRAPR